MLDKDKPTSSLTLSQRHITSDLVRLKTEHMSFLRTWSLLLKVMFWDALWGIKAGWSGTIIKIVSPFSFVFLLSIVEATALFTVLPFLALTAWLTYLFTSRFTRLMLFIWGHAVFIFALLSPVLAFLNWWVITIGNTSYTKEHMRTSSRIAMTKTDNLGYEKDYTMGRK